MMELSSRLLQSVCQPVADDSDKSMSTDIMIDYVR